MIGCMGMLKIITEEVAADTVEQRIQQIRCDLGMSQAEFALATGISRRTLNGMENGEKASRTTIVKVAEFLGMTDGQLMGPMRSMEIRAVRRDNTIAIEGHTIRKLQWPSERPFPDAA